MDDDKTNLLAAMYQDDESTNSTSIETTGFARTREIRVGAIRYQVPSVDYVVRLEQVVANQTRLIDQLRRDITRINGMMSTTRNFLRRQTNTIQELHAELDTKIGIVE